MKKLISILLASLMILLSIGCTEDSTTPAPEPGPGPGPGPEEPTEMVLDATIATSLGEANDGSCKIYWADGDRIIANATTSKALTEIEASSSSAQFAFDKTLDAPFSALYPISIYTTATEVTLPATQTEDSFGPNTAPMAAYSATEKNIEFNYLCAVVKVSLTVDATDADQISYIEFRGNADEQVSGKFTIDYENATLTALSTEEADQVVRINVSSALSAEGSTDFFVLVPAGLYNNGFTIKVVDAAEHVVEQTVPEEKTLVAGEIEVVEPFAFAPELPKSIVEIGSASDLVKFATDYNNLVYADYKPLEVKLTDDITFDEATNAAFVSIGGRFEAGENYFSGIFDGNGKSIKNWAATKPLFGYTLADAIIKELTIDASSSFSVAMGEQTDLYFGALVGYHRGALINCTNHANITLGGITTTKNVHLGGLAGRIVVGTIENCSMTGSISVASDFSTSNNINVGGITGYISNAEGSVKSTTMSGAIDWQGSVTDSKRLCLGGVAGCIVGSVVGCSTIAPAKITTLGAATYNTSLGGIVGLVDPNATVDNCENNAVMLTTMQRGEDASRYEYYGGVVGLNDGNVINSTNKASVQSRSAQKSIAIGGVVGYSRATGTVTNCINAGPVAARTSGVAPYGARYLQIGGVVGSNASVVSRVSNSGIIEVSRVEASSLVTLGLGGCIGQSTVDIIGGNEILNTGKVSMAIETSSMFYLAVGGVAGLLSNASISGVENQGEVVATPAAKVVNTYLGGVVGQIASTTAQTVTSVKNSGSASFSPKADGLGHSEIYTAGILAFADSTPVTITNAENTGAIMHKVDGTNVADKSAYLGGIAAGLKNAQSKIESCINSGTVRLGSFNNTATEGLAPYCGGIIGYISGTAAESPAQIKNCKNLQTATLYAKRGYLGGIVGCAKYVSVDGCRNEGSTASAISAYTGGIAGSLVTSNITNCVAKADLSSTSTAPFIGGIASWIDAASSVASSKYYGNETSTVAKCIFGGIVAKSVAGATISTCGFGGTINGTAMIPANVCGDANATLTDNYLWDGAE